MQRMEKWHCVAQASDIPEEDVVRVMIGQLGIAVYNVKGKYYATIDCCTHQEARLSEGFVIGNVIECPLHQGRFHIPTGAAKGAPVSRDVQTFPVQVVDGKVYVQLDEGTGAN